MPPPRAPPCACSARPGVWGVRPGAGAGSQPPSTVDQTGTTSCSPGPSAQTEGTRHTARLDKRLWRSLSMARIRSSLYVAACPTSYFHATSIRHSNSSTDALIQSAVQIRTHVDVLVASKDLPPACVPQALRVSVCSAAPQALRVSGELVASVQSFAAFLQHQIDTGGRQNTADVSRETRERPAGGRREVRMS